MTWRAWAASLLAASSVLAGCTSGSDDGGPPGPAASVPVTWSAVPLPAGFTPSLLAAGPDGSVLVAADGDVDGRPGPRLLQVRDGSVAAVPVAPASYYGRRTVWHGFAVRGQEIYAFGGRSGGAHGITRWTVWSGTLGRGGLSEDVQDFETFGGPTAGGLAQVVAPDAGPPLLAGSRVSEAGSGLDIALWRDDRGRWVRRPSAEPLTADDDHQPSVGTIARRGRGLVMAGSITSFDSGVHTRPAIWTAASADGPWTATVLPTESDEVAEARSAACGPDGRCVVVGYAAERLAAWTVSAEGGVAPAALPAVAGGPSAEHVAAYVAGDGFALTADDHLLLGDGEAWQELETPAGTPGGFTVAAGALWWAGGTRLWTAPLP